MLASLVMLFCLDERIESAFWPADAAMVVAFLVLPPKLSWLTCFACLAGNILVNRRTSYVPSENLLSAGLNVAFSLPPVPEDALLMPGSPCRPQEVESGSFLERRRSTDAEAAGGVQRDRADMHRVISFVCTEMSSN